MSAADAQAKRSHAGQIPVLRILKIEWLVLWVSGGSQPTVGPSYPGAPRTGRGLCPYSDRVFASLTNAVSSPARLDWSRCCVPLTRRLSIPWGILCGSLWVSGDSPGQEPQCWSGPEGYLYFYLFAIGVCVCVCVCI